MNRVLRLPSGNSNIAFIINLILLIIILGANSWVLWGLFGPKVELQIKAAVSDPPVIPLQNSPSATPNENRLVIPSIYLDEKINEGSTYAALNDGAWRRPASSTPELGGNTVLAGHRFTYQGKSIFYNLDKVNLGDEIGVTYNSKAYRYKVSETFIVDPSNPAIESPKNENILTLYTCTPMWSTDKRLVIIAKLEEGS